MVNSLANPTETRPAKKEKPREEPPGPAWTHRFRPTGQPPEHRLFDQIWLSPKLAEKGFRAFIDRRAKRRGRKRPRPRLGGD